MLNAFPKRARFAIFVLAAVYPLITGPVYLSTPLTQGWPIWQRNLLTTPPMVAAMVWVIIPTIQRLMRCPPAPSPS